MIHSISAQSGPLYTSGCDYKSENSEWFTSRWWQVTCPLCALRIIVHRKVVNMSDIPRLIDDPKYTHHRFHFSGRRFGFMWLEPTPLIYVYNRVEDQDAMQATHVKREGQVVTHPTLEEAQASAKEWIIMCAERFNDDGTLKTATARRPPSTGKRPTLNPPAPPKPYVPPGYEGELCDSCGKIDEGDFMPNPANMLTQVCMPCLVKASTS